ncbi:MAG TPA: hypothetical protein DCL60_09625 [Armatimonadetes bacterium]|jgi:hypothetical protein|nr:hypothetical protein [Armatimonadota bacterium]
MLPPQSGLAALCGLFPGYSLFIPFSGFGCKYRRITAVQEACMFLYEKELARLKEVLSRRGRENVVFRPANHMDIEYLEGLLYPENIVAFYKEAEPSGWVEIDGAILNSIANIWGENDNANPGNIVVPYGLLNIGNTASGDTFCIDLNTIGKDHEPDIVLVSHHLVREGQTYKEIREAIHPVARSFREFLHKFAESLLPVDYWDREMESRLENI